MWSTLTPKLLRLFSMLSSFTVANLVEIKNLNQDTNSSTLPNLSATNPQTDFIESGGQLCGLGYMQPDWSGHPFKLHGDGQYHSEFAQFGGLWSISVAADCQCRVNMHPGCDAGPSWYEVGPEGMIWTGGPDIWCYQCWVHTETK